MYPSNYTCFQRLSGTSGGRAAHTGCRCLVLLNPFGGKGKALSSFTELVAPVLAEAEMQFNMIVTERPGHAQELIQSIVLEVLYNVEMICLCPFVQMSFGEGNCLFFSYVCFAP